MADSIKGLEEVKADAEFNFLQRLREQEAKKQHELAKSGQTPAEPAPKK